MLSETALTAGVLAGGGGGGVVAELGQELREVLAPSSCWLG